MIEAVAEAAVERLLTAVVQSAGDELPHDLRAERIDGGVAIVGPAVRLRALTEARIAGLIQSVVRRR